MSNEPSTINHAVMEHTELEHLVNTEQYDKLEEQWLGIVESEIDDKKPLLHIINLLTRREKKFAHDFLIMLESYYSEKNAYHDLLEVLKYILKYFPKEKGLASKFAACYANIYKEKPYASLFISKSNIETSPEIAASLKMLEKYFMFEQGDYVYHKSWGVGKVVSFDPDGEKIHIDFEKKNNHGIALKIASDILQKLEKDSLRAMMYCQKDILNRMIDEDPVGLIRLALKHFHGKATLNNIKEQLMAGLLPPSAWSKWWTKAKKLILKDPYLQFTEGAPTTALLEIRTKPLTTHQEIINTLTQSGEIYKEIESARKYLAEGKNAEKCKETLQKIKSLFTQEAEKLKDTHPSAVIECLLLAEQVQIMLNECPANYKDMIETVIKNSDNLSKLIGNICILEYKKHVLNRIKKIYPEHWQDEFVSIFFDQSSHLWEFIIKELINENRQGALNNVSQKIFSQFNAYPEHYFWFCKNNFYGRFPDLYANINSGTLFIQLIELINNIYFKMQKGRDGNIRSIFNKIKGLLEEKGTDYAINHLTESNAAGMYNVVSGSKCIEDWFKISIESVIRDRFPEMIKKPEILTLDENKIYVTKQGYEKQKKELDHIMNIQFAENARDLGEAISRGDLRENAEYQAAREKQAQLIEKAERLKADLQKIVFIEPYTVKTNIVSPGTKVTIKNKDKETTETYTLLGPWDADIDKNIISYLSPIGKGLLNKKTGETVTIQLPENEIVCDIIKIEKAL
ncbi:transcription elongation factor GreA [Candidatus Kuenenia sp.]|uniref:transcription elongation factor GreA n=1 Tax=Candidatus Kuenenia sp. TaxID=2499824 RepID=UPI00321F8787